MNQSSGLLGYPADARLLIVNADDFGMCHAVNDAIVRTLWAGVVRSTTLMTPCPWAGHAMRLLKEHPELSFGVHLTAICETPDYRWGPLSPRERVPSLLDESGYFDSLQRIPDFLGRAELPELEIEFRAQIKRVLAAGLRPTHVDWHCLHNGGSPAIFDMTLGLAYEYGLAVRVAGRPLAQRMQRRGLPTNDHDLLDSFRLDTSDKSARYVQMLRELPVGLTEWAVHPGFDTAELRAVQPDGSRVRQTDFDFFASPEARDVVQQEGILLLDYRQMQVAWNAR